MLNLKFRLLFYIVYPKNFAISDYGAVILNKYANYYTGYYSSHNVGVFESKIKKKQKKTI